ncbi:hypothetical protein [Povalibacter sp.]|uniref:hypothetical protein n=1 Tax=Povalibacter sp. TaxID=1962978 RepID=UPI002D1FB050|nr:hypothetical protein [Povalibacter sp.]
MPAALFLSFATRADAPFIENGRAGFVVSDIKYALADDAEKTGACPQGMSRNVEEIFALTAEGRRRKGESDEAYARRLNDGGKKLSTAPDGQNVCMNPEAAAPDPNFRTLRSTSIPIDGIDIDGVDSRADASTPQSCPHQDAVGKQGQRGVDNQFARVVGCSRSYQSTGQSNGYAIEMLTGAWGILISLDGVDDIRNDDSVEVGIHANADPIQLSPARVPLPYATYAMDQDPRFRAKTRGRIEDGVLTTEPVDVRFHTITNSLHMERAMNHARLQVTIAQDGSLSGYLAGYTPVETMYDYQFGYRNGKNAKGEPGPLPLRLGTGNGAARVLGYTCPGAYYALYDYADGDPDANGRCTSISTQYRIAAIPAFVVDVATGSVNDRLVDKAPAKQ